MTPWMVLTVSVAAINLAAFTALRGRWDRRLVILGLASLVGTAAGNAIGARTGLEVVRLGDFHLVAACLAAQLAMLVTDLLAHLGPSSPPR
jgi:lipoprotein signal peptidase